MPDVSLNGIEFKIRGSSNEASASVQHLIDKVNELRSSMSGLKSVQTTANALKNVGNAAKKAATPLSNFASSLKRIAFYRILRGILKSITQAFKEGLKNAYEFSKATGDQAGLAAALDQLATKSLTMKNQLGAAFGQLLTAVTPIIVQIIGWVTKLAEALTRLIAILGGSDYYLRAKDVWTEWGDAAASAGGAAKKALEYLAPFDELNVLPDPRSGGGGGGTAANYADMFDYVNTSEGSGFLDSIKDMLDKVSDFFETKNWRELADNVWQKLKEAFSDNGKATEVIESLFEALGAGIGAASSFVVQLCKNLFSSFKENIKDYGGDGRIDALDFLEAAIITVVDMEHWIKQHIVDPFFEGFAKAWGMSGKEELYDAIVNFGIDIVNWFTQNVINPVILAWNNFVNSLPNWLQDLIKDSLGVNELTIPMIGEIDHVNTAGLTAAQKVITAMTAGITKIQDKLTTKQRTLQTNADMVGRYDHLTTKQRTLQTNADMVGRYDHLTTKQRTLQTNANMVGRYDNLTTKQRTLQTNANMVGRYDNLTTKQRTLQTNANMVGRYDNLTDAQRTLSSTANFNTRKIGQNLSTAFESTADFVSRTIGISTSFDSSARINSYSIIDSLRDWNGNMNVDAKVNIVGQTNVPTVAVNASYNTPMVKAMGGAFYGGNWHDIPQYASGGSPHGSLFVAGEAGAELVGHIGGRTEVLNQSQIAASIAAGVHRTLSASGVRAGGSYSLSDGSNEDILYRAFRRALDETDFGGDVELDGDTIYRAMVRRNRANTRLTGVNAMA